jgi:mono/diheme cytochrome c family protein
LLDVAFTAVLILVLGLLARLMPAELGPEANPADTRFLPRPEWYYVPVFQWLKYWPGARAVVGIVVIPTLIAALFAGLPFIDRGSERRPSRRLFTLGAFAVVMLALVALGVQSRVQDERDPAIARQLAVQHDAVNAFMAEPFEPELAAGSLRVENAALANPLVAHGKEIFAVQSCDVCHGADARGTDSAPSLIGVAAKYRNGQLRELLVMPNAKMSDGGMQPLDAPDPDIDALVAYLESLK